MSLVTVTSIGAPLAEITGTRRIMVNSDALPIAHGLVMVAMLQASFDLGPYKIASPTPLFSLPQPDWQGLKPMWVH